MFGALGSARHSASFLRLYVVYEVDDRNLVPWRFIPFDDSETVLLCHGTGDGGEQPSRPSDVDLGIPVFRVPGTGSQSPKRASAVAMKTRVNGVAPLPEPPQLPCLQ